MIFYGAGGHAKVVIEAWVASGGKVTAIYDDDQSIKILLGKNVGGRYKADAFPDSKLVISIGHNNIRQNIVQHVVHLFGTVIHPSAIVSSSAKTGVGTVIMAGSVVQAETVISNHAILNTSCRVDHDCHVGDFVHIAPGAILCGDVRVGEGALIGAGATILPGVSIGRWAIVGAGSVVTNDVAEATVVMGIPSKTRPGSSSTTTEKPGI